jgi:hypothetical protein
MSLYQIGFIGAPDPALLSDLEKALADRLADFGLAIGAEVEIVTKIGDLFQPSKAAKVVAYFGHIGAVDAPDLARLVMSAIPMLPIATGTTEFNNEIPPCLRHVNGVKVLPEREQAILRISTCLLECLGLLRVQRKVFLSYRRIESQDAAIQLHESLSARQFDVFLDTHDVRPAEDFQEQLWHRLSDCDVLVMLDTPGYFASRWTAEEFGRAEAKFLAILRVGWPGHPVSRMLHLGEDLQLAVGEVDSKGRLAAAAIQRVDCAVERLRAKSIAVRHSALASAFMDAVTDHGGTVHGVSVGRTISATLHDGRNVIGVPAVGIPTSESLQHAALSATSMTATEAAIIYDHVGLRSRYVDHLKWLHDKVKDVRWVWQANASSDLAKW